jgi:hypothetical protein
MATARLRGAGKAKQDQSQTDCGRCNELPHDSPPM